MKCIPIHRWNLPAAAGLLVLLAPCMAGTTFAREPSADAEAWHFRADAYLWAPAVGGESASGADIDIEFSDIARNLELAFMGTIAAERSKWLLELDAIYLDIEDDDGIDVAPVVELDDVELSGWILNPFVGYKVLEHGESHLSILAGARYLDLELTVGVRTRPPAPSVKLSETGSEDYLDGIVGVIGRIQLNDRWGLPYYLDVGTGDTDFTWQMFLGASYAFKSVEVLAGYRYLDWEFEDDDPVFNDLNLGGPMLGARWRF